MKNSFSKETLPPQESETLKDWEQISEPLKFKKFQDFLDSEFFKKSYKLPTYIWRNPTTWEQATLEYYFAEESSDERFLILYHLYDPNYYKWVRSIQRILISLWYMTEEDLESKTIYDESGEITSYFWIYGPKTEQKVKNFQSFSWLKPDGKVGEITIARLYEEVFQKFHQITKDEATQELLWSLRSELP